MTYLQVLTNDYECGMFSLIPLILSSLFLCFSPVLANVEKVIFVVPSSSIDLTQLSAVDFPNLRTISPLQESNVRTLLESAFPTIENPLGHETWFHLEGLTQHQRYELRVCWAATVSRMLHYRTLIFQASIRVIWVENKL